MSDKIIEYYKKFMKASDSELYEYLDGIEFMENEEERYAKELFELSQRTFEVKAVLYHLQNKLYDTKKEMVKYGKKMQEENKEEYDRLADIAEKLGIKVDEGDFDNE